MKTLFPNVLDIQFFKCIKHIGNTFYEARIYNINS